MIRLNRASDYALAALSGVLLALSFPRFGFPAFSWIALTPLLVALERRPLARAFGLGWTTGILYFLGTLYWLARVMVMYGGLQSWVAVPVNGALILFLALFPAVFAVVVARSTRAFGPRALLLAPFVWTATEFGRTHLLGGFPWVLLGYSQARVLPIAQLASVFGVFGVSALVAGVSAAAAFAVRATSPPEAVPRHARDGRITDGIAHVDRASGSWRALQPFLPAIIMLAVVGAVAGWGSRRVARAEWTRAGDPVRVGLVQGNIDQAEKWDATRRAAIFAGYLRLTRQAIEEGAQLILWPESSTPFRFEEDRGDADQLRRLAAEASVPILIGSEQIERGTPNKYYNAAFLIQPDGSTGGVYHKMHLVPFGEYVPFKRILFFAAPLVEAAGDFSPGDRAVLLPARGHLLSVAICYEIVYPDLIRQFTRNGSELITTITNDAWFGETSAPYQHFEQASMRSIEEGRYLVRAANTGISGIVDPYGRVLAESHLFEPAVVVGEARFLRVMTVYARYGDLFAYLSVVLAVVMLLQSRAWRLSTN